MSISNQTNKIFISGDGVTATFSFNFKIFAASDLAVYKISAAKVATLQTITTDYTVTINSVSEGGTVVFVVPPPSLTTGLLKRVEPFTQSLVLATEGNLPAKQIENQLDLMTMLCVQVNEVVSRCAQLSTTSAITMVTLPDPVDGNAPVWSGTAGAMVNAPITAAAITTSVAAAAASAAAAAASQASATASAAAAAASAATVAAVLAAIYPVGSIYSNYSNATNPGTLLGIGTWVALGGVIPIGIDGSTEFLTIGQTGGSKTKDVRHTHVVSGQTAASGVSGNCDGSSTGFVGDHQHNVNITSQTGGSATQDVLNPYRVVYMWRRTV